MLNRLRDQSLCYKDQVDSFYVIQVKESVFMLNRLREQSLYHYSFWSSLYVIKIKGADFIIYKLRDQSLCYTDSGGSFNDRHYGQLRFAYLPWILVVWNWLRLAKVTHVKLRILAVQLLILSTPSQFVNSISGEHILIKFQTNKNLFFSQLSSCGVKLIAYYHR